jgi:TM2 domain-containing membrane protein YozV
MSIVPSSRKVPAGLLAIFLGAFGVHKFYLGMYRAGAVMLLATLAGMVLTCLGIGPLVVGAMGLIGFVEGIIYFVRSDSDFYNTYFVRRQEWF